MAYGKPVKKKKKTVETKERKVKKQTFEVGGGQKASTYAGPAINRLVADGGWGWGGGDPHSTESISRPTPPVAPPRPKKGGG